MSKAVHGFVRLFVAVAGVVLFGASFAHAVQSSGSIQLVPSKQIGIVQNENITVDVYFSNTSTQTPPQALIPAIANVTGPITIDLGCVDCGCSQQNPAALSFVAGGQSGCTSKGAGVASCAAGAPGEVLINLDPAGINAPNATPVFLATITLKNNLPELPVLGLRAGTGVCAVKACVTPPNQQCAFCSAEGCSFLAGISPQQELLRCKHSCFNQVNFTNALDAYIFQGVAIIDDPNFDPANESFTLSFGVPGNPIINISIPGGIPNTGVDVWTLAGPGNQNTPGIDLIKITRQTGAGCQNSFRLQVKFFGDLSSLQALPPNPVLRTVLTFDGRTPFVNEEAWQTLQNGNLRNDIDVISSC